MVAGRARSGGRVLVLVGWRSNIGRGDFPISIADVLADAARRRRSRPASSSSWSCGCPARSPARWSAPRWPCPARSPRPIARNPLASPDILGVTAGASAAAVAVIVLGGGFGAVGGLVAAVGLPIAALIGGLLTAALGLRAGLAARASRATGWCWSASGSARCCSLIVHWLLVVGRDLRGRAGHGLAHRHPQRPRLGARGAGRRWRWRCWCRPRWCSRSASARCSSATTPPAASACGSTGARAALLLVAVGLAAVATASRRADRVRRAGRAADRAAAGRRRPPADAGLGGRTGPRSLVVADLVARTALGDRAAGRHRHRRARRPVPALPARPPQPEGPCMTHDSQDRPSDDATPARRPAAGRARPAGLRRRTSSSTGSTSTSSTAPSPR